MNRRIHRPSPIQSLNTLKKTILGRKLLHAQPVIKIKSKCLWLNPEKKKNKNRFRKKIFECSVQTATIPQHPTAKQWLKVSDSLNSDVYSDSYVSEGANTLGSGRSCFVGHFQVKGVGRTVLAPPPVKLSKSSISTFSISDGRCEPRTIYTEIVLSKWISKLLNQPYIKLEAVLEDQNGNLLLVREGSPIRLGHLFLLEAISRQFGTGRKSEIIWKNFFNSHLGKLELDVSINAFRKYVETHLINAVEITAACRIFGVTLQNYGDNYDVHNRLFDLEDAKVCFKNPRGPKTQISFSKCNILKLLEQFQIDEFSDRRFKTFQTLSSFVKTINIFENFIFGRKLNLISSLKIKTNYNKLLLVQLTRLTGVTQIILIKKLRIKIGLRLNLIPDSELPEFRSDLFLKFLLELHYGNAISFQDQITFEYSVSCWFYPILKSHHKSLNSIVKIWETNFFLISEEGFYSSYYKIKKELTNKPRKQARTILIDNLKTHFNKLT